jgi:hypothetical protein
VGYTADHQNGILKRRYLLIINVKRKAILEINQAKMMSMMALTSLLLLSTWLLKI